MDRKRLRNSIICLAIAALLYLTLTEFTFEGFALAWHARYGMVASLRQYRGSRYDVKVPTFWWPQLDEGGWNVTLMRRPGKIRSMFGDSDWAMVSVSVAPTISAETVRQGAALVDRRLETTTQEMAKVFVGGQELHCFEQKSNKGEAAALAQTFDLTQIQCLPASEKNRLSATFFGSRRLVPDFFRILGTITKSD